MPARSVVATLHSPQKLQRELADLQLVMRARNGDSKALDELIRRYQGFVRLKASSYFLAGGGSRTGRSDCSDRSSSSRWLSGWAPAVKARGRRAEALPRGRVVRDDGRAPRLRHEDDRQRVAAREAQGAVAPAVATSALVVF